MSLVADYSDSDDDGTTETLQQSSNVVTSVSTKSKQFFSTSDSDDEDEEAEEEHDNQDALMKSNQNQREKTELKNPFRNFGTGDVQKADSVFQIAFLEQEVEKSAALERHVQMTHRAGSQDMINGKKICWNHRKGKCRFGHNCIFAHDSDIPEKVVPKTTTPVTTTPVTVPVVPPGEKETSPEDPPQEYDESAVVISSVHLSKTSSSSRSSSNNEFQLSPERNPDGIGKKGKRVRPGLCQSLVPGKKVMKIFKKHC